MLNNLLKVIQLVDEEVKFQCRLPGTKICHINTTQYGWKSGFGIFLSNISQFCLGEYGEN